MKKILCLIDTLRIGGGAQTQICGLAMMLKKRGYDVKTLSYFKVEDENSLIPELKRQGIDSYCVTDAKSKLDKFLKIFRYIKLFQPDYVISYIDGATSISCIAKVFYSHFKLIVSERNVTQKLSFKEKVKFFLYKKADFIVPNAYSQAAFIGENFKSLEHKIETISNFVDTDLYKFRELPDKNVILKILVVARIGPQKNVLGFLESLKILKLKGLKFHVDWYGKSYPEYYTLCKNKVSEYQLESYIEFHKPRKQIVEIYQNSEFDVFCLPSFFEGCPNTIGEAMSCGYPILCSDVCDNSRYVKNEKNGLLFNPKNIHDIANKILLYSEMSYEDKVMMGINSRKIAESFLSRESFIQKYINIIES